MVAERDRPEHRGVAVDVDHCPADRPGELPRIADCLRNERHARDRLLIEQVEHHGQRRILHVQAPVGAHDADDLHLDVV